MKNFVPAEPCEGCDLRVLKMSAGIKFIGNQAKRTHIYTVLFAVYPAKSCFYAVYTAIYTLYMYSRVRYCSLNMCVYNKSQFFAFNDIITTRITIYTYTYVIYIYSVDAFIIILYVVFQEFREGYYNI